MGRVGVYKYLLACTLDNTGTAITSTVVLPTEYKVEPQSVRDDYKTDHGVRSRMLGSVERGLDRRRTGKCTRLKCAFCGGQEERQD